MATQGLDNGAGDVNAAKKRVNWPAAIGSYLKILYQGIYWEKPVGKRHTGTRRATRREGNVG